jgi:transcriptional regulator with XRE-family HTH domain
MLGILEMEYYELYIMRIKTLCEQREISINKLATMSGINQSTIDNIVRGQTKNPKAKTLHKISLAFNMTLSEFLDFPELNNYCFEDDSEE